MNKKDILKNKKVIFVLLAIVAVLVVTVVSVVMINNNKGTEKKVKKESKEAITEQGIIKDETFGNLNFSNTTLIKDGDQYTLSMDVTNTTQSEIDIEQVNVNLKDKDGNSVIVLLGYIGDPMKAGETRTVTSSVATDLSKVKSKTIEEKKGNE